jgi:hypothetical protein
MLESSNPDLITTKKKKRHDTTLDEPHTHTRQMSSLNRYWPPNLAQFDMRKK